MIGNVALVLQFVGLTHHQIEVRIVVNRGAYSRVVVYELFLRHLENVKFELEIFSVDSGEINP